MRHPFLIPAVALAAVAACGGSDSNGPPNNPPAADVSVVSGAFTKGFQAYAPDTFAVSLGAGGTVTWRNDDGIGHTVTDTTVANAFSIGLAGRNDTASVVFAAVGEYPYKCSIHDTMRGLVIVNP
jgi:plastocyanin